MTHRSGFALLVSVLMIVALATLALGVLAVGARELRIAGAAEQLLEARAVAESGARTELARWSTRRWDALERGEVRQGLAGHHHRQSSVERLDSGLFLIRSEARLASAAGSGPVARAGLLVRTFPVSALAPIFPAALTSTGTVLLRRGEVHGGASEGGRRTSVALIPEHAPGVMAPEVIGEDDVPITGAPAVLLLEPTPPAPDLVALTSREGFQRLLPPSRVVAPGPVSSGNDCVQDAANWGALDPADPCHELWPVIHAPSDLEITGGEARAVLVVAGDLVVGGDARLEGVVLVAGALVLQEGAHVHGAVRAGAVEVRAGTVRWDPALVHDALAAPAFDRGFRPPGRWWLPVF